MTPHPADRAQQPTVSVCLATFDGARYLCQQIDSVLAQLGPHDELVVSDDGSTDDTPRLLASYGDRLRIVGTTRAGGVVRNFERALAACRGDLVVLCDQDDVWLDGRLDLVRERLARSSMVMMNGTVVDAELSPTGRDVFQLVGFHRGFLRTLAANTYVGCCMAFRREVLNVALPFPPRIQWHDWFLALIGEALFDIDLCAERTLLFRRHASNASNTGQRSTASLWRRLVARGWMLRAVVTAWRRRRHRVGGRT